MLKNYLKVAFKVFLRRKFFTFISLFAISFTLLVLMVATSLVDHVIGPLSPENKLSRTLGVYFLSLGGENNQSNGLPGYGFLDRYARNLPGVEKMSIFEQVGYKDAYRNSEKISLYVKRTDGEFWQIHEFNFLAGGPFTSDDDKNVNFVAVINESTRKKFFDDQSVLAALGQTIEVDGQRFRVVGVVADVPILRAIPFADIWVPISTTSSASYRRDLQGSYQAALLARSRADFPAIKSEFASRLPNIEFPNPKEFNVARAGADTRFEAVARMFIGNGRETYPRTLLAILLGLALLFMVLPTVNLINLNVSRILERASEIGVRKAFGASSWTLVGQFVVENVLLTLIGGLIGLVLSVFVLRLVNQSGWIPYADFQLNYRIFLYGLALAIFFGLFSGVYPAWKMSRLNPVEALKGGTR
ncbi:MAG: FtsX-like permease family protein [Acidobacteria bacterium]|nr:FtsX-like permease family protein [Acidobacteriota bacterium]